ncbi:hypothetical protein [Hyalangium versicolor]|uniref:hypothetical protein n=1 Tax=Hyalangium versicolor TaxID=2861190 RepID=UPI001CCBD0F2|nr:hypothetical protein [Hyalangium versicolor]
MSLLSPRLRATVLALGLSPLCVSAAEPAPEPSQAEATPWGRQETRLDLGLSAGLHAPSGVFGLELEFRPIEWLGLQVGGGTDAWGYRVSPLLRVYPLGSRRFSPFVEAGASFNLGQERTVRGADGAELPVELLFTPVAVVGVGVRGNLGAHAFVSPRLGWSKRLREDNIRMMSNGRFIESSDLKSSLDQQQGLLMSLSVGVSFL